MSIVESYETTQGRSPTRVHQRGVGYDLHSKNETHERLIEVKGISESWGTYNWQPLHHTEVEVLQRDPTHFFLYIVHFDIDRENRNESYLATAAYNLFVISGEEIQKRFRVIPESFAVKPISRRQLATYEVVHNPVAQSAAEDI